MNLVAELSNFRVRGKFTAINFGQYLANDRARRMVYCDSAPGTGLAGEKKIIMEIFSTIISFLKKTKSYFERSQLPGLKALCAVSVIPADSDCAPYRVL